jgi:hypothetical protein
VQKAEVPTSHASLLLVACLLCLAFDADAAIAARNEGVERCDHDKSGPLLAPSFSESFSILLSCPDVPLEEACPDDLEVAGVQ